MSRSPEPVPLKLAGRYELMRTQATDANTASLLAWDTRLKRWRSIRVARPGDEAASRRMLAVAQWAAKLEHPALERVIDVGTDGTVVYVVRDRLVGSVSDHLRRRGAVSPEWALQVVTRCAEGLAWAHPRGIVHGHPRPDVVQFSEDGSAVLTSFGQRAVLRDTPETRAGADWAHLAPELRQTWQPEPATDVYALGALLYMLLAGKPSADLFYAEAYEGLLSAVPRNLRPLLHRACAFAPSERLTTQRLHESLRKAQAEYDVPRAPAPWLESTQEFPDRNQYDGLDAILAEIAPHLDTPQPPEAFGALDRTADSSSGSLHDEPTVPPGTAMPGRSATPPSAPRRATPPSAPRRATPPSAPRRAPPPSAPRNTGPPTPPSAPRKASPPPAASYVAPPAPGYTAPGTPPPGPASAPASYPGYVMPSPTLDDHIPGTSRPDDTLPSGGESFMGVKYYDQPSESAPVLPSPMQAAKPERIEPSFTASDASEGPSAGGVLRVVLGGTLFGLLLTVIGAGLFWFVSTSPVRADDALISAVEAEQTSIARIISADRDLQRKWQSFERAPPETRAPIAADLVKALEDRVIGPDAPPTEFEIEAAVKRLGQARDSWAFYQ